MAIDDLIQDATRRMHKSVEAAQAEFATLRTGRASPGLLDRVQIDYYGQKTPLKQLATLNSPEPRLLTIQPFDPNSVSAIERAIQESDLGLTPSNDGKLIRLPIPHLKELVDKGEVGSDEEHRAEERVQKLTDENTHTIDELLKKKEAEILEV